MPPYYIIGSPNHKWGDYGNTLVRGYASIVDGVCRVQRTGPFVPPIVVGSAIVVTQALRDEMKAEKFTGFRFIRAEKYKIVDLPWHEWNQDSPYPAEYPESGEPDDYIERGQHSAAVAAQMPELWGLHIPRIACVRRNRPIVRSRRALRLVAESTKGRDFVRSRDVLLCYVSARAKKWLQARVGEWVTFEKATMEG